jgi:hypothetical protein
LQEIVQLQKYLSARTLIGLGFETRLGAVHDDMVMWAEANSLPCPSISRMYNLLCQIGLKITPDGRLLGAAIKT